MEYIYRITGCFVNLVSYPALPGVKIHPPIKILVKHMFMEPNSEVVTLPNVNIWSVLNVAHAKENLKRKLKFPTTP